MVQCAVFSVECFGPGVSGCLVLSVECFGSRMKSDGLWAYLGWVLGWRVLEKSWGQGERAERVDKREMGVPKETGPPIPYVAKRWSHWNDSLGNSLRIRV